MSTRRRTPTRTEMRRLLDELVPIGFIPRRVDITPDGGVTLHADPAEGAVKVDPLEEWEAKRARRPN